MEQGCSIDRFSALRYVNSPVDASRPQVHFPPVRRREHFDILSLIRPRTQALVRFDLLLINPLFRGFSAFAFVIPSVAYAKISACSLPILCLLLETMLNFNLFRMVLRELQWAPRKVLYSISSSTYVQQLSGPRN